MIRVRVKQDGLLVVMVSLAGWGGPWRWEHLLTAAFSKVRYNNLMRWSWRGKKTIGIVIPEIKVRVKQDGLLGF